MQFESTRVESPLGPLRVVAGPAGLCQVQFDDEADHLRETLARRFGAVEWHDAPDPAGAASALGRYFAGALDALDALPVDPHGTEFQLDVWHALRRIPAGHTWSYAELARAVGRPRAVRAVGAANGANPLALVLPCHRVIGADGRLTGYGGGLDRKAWLLRHEGALL